MNYFYSLKITLLLLELSLNYLSSCGQIDNKGADEKLIENLHSITKNETVQIDSIQAQEIGDNLKETLKSEDYYPNWKWYYFKEGKFKTKFPVKPLTGISNKKLESKNIAFTTVFLTEEEYNLPISAYSVSYSKMPDYNINQLDSLFEVIRNYIIYEYGKITMETRVVQSNKDPVNEYEYYINKENNYN